MVSVKLSQTLTHRLCTYYIKRRDVVTMEKFAEVAKGACVFLVFICVFLIIGLAGGLETDAITEWEFIISSISLLVSAGFSTLMYKLIEWEGEKHGWKDV